MKEFTVRVLHEDGEAVESTEHQYFDLAEEEYTDCVLFYKEEKFRGSVQLFHTESGNMIYETYCG